ncbi:MAG: hypothetical protein RR261_07200, partial [Oscillospiraceae bacterium]
GDRFAPPLKRALERKRSRRCIRRPCFRDDIRRTVNKDGAAYLLALIILPEFDFEHARYFMFSASLFLSFCHAGIIMPRSVR